MEAVASLDALALRLDWTLNADEERIANAALEDLSDEARFHGSMIWRDELSTPRMVQSIVLRAATRYMRNPDGYSQSRAGDETVIWGDQNDSAGSASFNHGEIVTLKQMGGRLGLVSAQIEAWGTKERPAGYVPVAGGGDPFPFFEHDDSPW